MMHSPSDLPVLTTWLLLIDVWFGLVGFGFPGEYSDWQLQPRNSPRKFGGKWAQRR